LIYVNIAPPPSTYVRASARRRSATRLHASFSLRARFRIEGAGGP
jgi:hypothetical protein